MNNIDFEKITSGEGLMVDDIRIVMEKMDKLKVIGWTEYSFLENVSKQIALKELDAIKKKFEHLLEKDNRIRSLADKINVRYILAYD